MRYTLPSSPSLAPIPTTNVTTAFFVPPPGVIDPTVLTAFGEILTFAGSLIGIDYHYRYKGN